MKRFFLLLFFIMAPISSAFSAENVAAGDSKNNRIIEGEVIELEPQKIILPDIDDTELNDGKPLEDVVIEEDVYKTGISKYYSFDKGILKIHPHEKLNFDFGMIGNMDWLVDRKDDDLHSRFQIPTADLLLSGKINKYIDYKAQMFADRNIDEQTILGDLWVRGRYKNYILQAGRMRKPFAYEPTFSLYDLDFATRSQIGRLFGDHRDTGGKFIAEYKYADLALGLYASMQNRPFYLHSRGIEFDSWLVLKPLANFPEKGELKLAGGIATGKRDNSYNNYSAFASYKYKKFCIKSEYIYKEPTFYDEKFADGFYVDGTYFLTDKLQAAVRFDSYNPNNKNSNRRNNEYVAGLNYYFNNRNIMLVLNYIFSDGVTNSHRVALQMRYRTW